MGRGATLDGAGRACRPSSKSSRSRPGRGWWWPLAFRTDLDLLAPLGTGSGNSAAFFVQFRKPDGERVDEAEAMMARRVDGPPGLEKVLPPDDPLLAEAEPWCDQATMQFYPDCLPYEGLWTAYPDFLVPVTFARSWAARSLGGDDSGQAMGDFRRAIRLGHLLRQEDRFLLADLIGLACISAGVEASPYRRGLHQECRRRPRSAAPGPELSVRRSRSRGSCRWLVSSSISTPMTRTRDPGARQPSV